MIAFHWLVIKIGPKWLNWNSLSLISYSVPLCIKLSASTVVLSMWTCKNIFHIQVELFTVFATPPINLNLGQQIDWGLLVANHLDQSLWWANEKHWAAVRSHVLHSFSACAQGCCVFYQPRQAVKSYWTKTIFLFSSNFRGQDPLTEHRWRFQLLWVWIGKWLYTILCVINILKKPKWEGGIMGGAPLNTKYILHFSFVAKSWR